MHLILLMNSHYSTIIQNTIFTFTLDGAVLEKYMLVNIMNKKNTDMFHNFPLDDS